jgi:hypothetical protein
MAVEMIRVEEPPVEEGMADRLWAQAKKRPYLAVLASPLAVIAAPIATGVVSITAAAAGTTVVVAAANRFFGTPHLQITRYTVEQAKGIVDSSDEPLALNETYLRHPRARECGVIVRSADFHSFIMSQKVTEIIQYMRSETLLTSLRILIRSADSKHAVVGGQLQAVPASLRGDVSRSNERKINLTYDEPERTNHKPSYVWIRDFPEVVAATLNARRGTMNFSQATDMSFGLSGKAASVANFDAGWLSKFVIEIEASFA